MDDKEKSNGLDATDKTILMMLQDDARTPLKKIAEKAGVSIDTVHKRMRHLISDDTIYLSGLIEPRNVGFPLIADVKVRLKNIDEKSKQEFLGYLVKHPRCTDIFEIMGQYDLTCVFVATDSDDLADISYEVRSRFRDIIDEWMSVLVLRTHKFNWYSL